MTVEKTLAIAGLSPGKYKVTVKINDAISKQEIAQSAPFVVRIGDIPCRRQPDKRIRGLAVGSICSEDARDAAGLRSVLMKRSTHLAGFAVLIVVGSCSSIWSGVSIGVRGWFAIRPACRKSARRCELLRPDLSVVASVYTDGAGRFLISSLMPGPLCSQGDGALVSARVARKREGPRRHCRQSHAEHALRSDPVASGAAARPQLAKG